MWTAEKVCALGALYWVCHVM